MRERLHATHGTADLELQPTDSNEVLDSLKFHSFKSVVVALGGEGTDPSGPSSTGTFSTAIDLYHEGYDVHMYNENEVDDDGTGDAVIEALDAIQARKVTEVAIFGYSHGGGSTYDLSDILDRNRALIQGSFDIVYTSYLDAVQNNGDGDIFQENKYPSGSKHHVNHYQNGSMVDFGLEGGPTNNPPGANFELDVETTSWGANATHFTIDNLSEVNDKIGKTLKNQTSR